MAKVYEILELARQVNDTISRMTSLDSTLSALDVTKETMFEQGESTATIATAMNAVLDECDALASLIATDLDAIPIGTTWAEEYRLGSPMEFRSWNLDFGSTPRTITTYEEGGLVTIGVYIATPADGDIYQLVGAEDAENSGREFTLNGGGHTTEVIKSVAGVSGAVDNADETKMRLILRER